MNLMIYARTIKKNEMPGMEICLKDSKKWQMDPARQLLEFSALIIEGCWEGLVRGGLCFQVIRN
jgi:hypothetical protein